MKKIIFAGLDNGGKTSIIYSLEKKFSLLNSIRPTLGASRNDSSIKILGLDIVHWDLGGQKRYRDKYMKEKFSIFSNVSLMFYVIDIIDQERYDETMEYLEKILELYENLNENPIISICFHKIDPDKRKLDSIDKDIKKITKRIEEMKNNFIIKYYRTSIHDDTTIIRAFSDGILEISEKSKMINDLLKEYAKKTFSSAVVLLDDNSFILGAHYKKKRFLEICQTVAPRFALTMERLEDYELTAENVLVNVTFNESDDDNTERKAMVFLRDFKIEDDIRIFIISLAKNEKTLRLSLNFLPELAEKIQNLMHSLET
ncbi:MAG: hypothetical protein GY870_18930 [archaeon]|nr:hypothetical protein [archaeon]